MNTATSPPIDLFSALKIDKALEIVRRVRKSPSRYLLVPMHAMHGGYLIEIDTAEVAELDDDGAVFLLLLAFEQGADLTAG